MISNTRSSRLPYTEGYRPTPCVGDGGLSRVFPYNPEAGFYFNDWNSILRGVVDAAVVFRFGHILPAKPQYPITWYEV